MLLTAIWNILSKLEPYSPDGFMTDMPTKSPMIVTTAQALNILKSRGYIIRDEVLAT